MAKTTVIKILISTDWVVNWGTENEKCVEKSKFLMIGD